VDDLDPALSDELDHVPQDGDREPVGADAHELGAERRTLPLVGSPGRPGDRELELGAGETGHEIPEVSRSAAEIDGDEQLEYAQRRRHVSRRGRRV
jgi:hypothetical protein